MGNKLGIAGEVVATTAFVLFMVAVAVIGTPIMAAIDLWRKIRA